MRSAILIMAFECVGRTFLSAGSGGFPVAAGLESPANRQARKPAPLHNETSPNFFTRLAPMNLIGLGSAQALGAA